MTSNSARPDSRDATVSGQPLWLPPGTTFALLPKPVQQAIIDILNPAYQKYVLEAGDALERGQGLSYLAGATGIPHGLWAIVTTKPKRRAYASVSSAPKRTTCEE